MLMTAIKSVFNFYMLCVQPLLGLFLVGYSIWGSVGISAITPAKRFLPDGNHLFSVRSCS